MVLGKRGHARPPLNCRSVGDSALGLMGTLPSLEELRQLESSVAQVWCSLGLLRATSQPETKPPAS